MYESQNNTKFHVHKLRWYPIKFLKIYLYYLASVIKSRDDKQPYMNSRFSQLCPWYLHVAIVIKIFRHLELSTENTAINLYITLGTKL